MAAHEYAFTLTPGGSSRARSVTIACAAIAAVCVLSSSVVMRELVATQPARAVAAATAATPIVTTARTWALEQRWWPGQIRQSARPTTPATTTATASAPATTTATAPAPATAAVPDNELTFAKGYQLRLAARQATQPAAQPTQPASVPAPVVANAPSSDSQSGRVATTVRKPSTLARTETPIVHPVSATREQAADPFGRFDAGSRALAYDERRERSFPQYRPAPPPRGLFGTLY